MAPLRKVGPRFKVRLENLRRGRNYLPRIYHQSRFVTKLWRFRRQHTEDHFWWFWWNPDQHPPGGAGCCPSHRSAGSPAVGGLGLSKAQGCLFFREILVILFILWLFFFIKKSFAFFSLSYFYIAVCGWSLIFHRLCFRIFHFVLCSHCFNLIAAEKPLPSPMPLNGDFQYQNLIQLRKNKIP